MTDTSDLVERLRIVDSPDYGKNIHLTVRREDVSKAATALAAKDKEIESLRERIDNAAQASAETQPDWKHRCYRIMGALGFDYGDPDWVMPDEQKRIDLALARAETAERVFEDILDELGCERNNEAALQAIAVLKARVTALRNRTETAERERDEARAALTPSADTKAAYIGEFHFEIEDRDEDGEECSRKVAVPWTTIKEIMAAIREHAGRAVIEQGE